MRKPSRLGLHCRQGLVHEGLLHPNDHWFDFGNLFLELKFCILFFTQAASGCFLLDQSEDQSN